MAPKGLVFDIGMHRGQDTGYYLSRGYQVVAVDADPRQIQEARQRFAPALERGDLRLIHCAVGPDEGQVEFHLSNRTAWSSLKKDVSSRNNLYQESISVPSRRLSSLMREHGVPHYCKIDVEGYDAVCLETLGDLPELPRFISVESECAGEAERLTDAEAQRTLDLLQELGYQRFKLVEQGSLAVLSPQAPPLFRFPTLWQRLLRRLRLWDGKSETFQGFSEANRRRLQQQHDYEFVYGATGPFGRDLDGDWLTYPQARAELRRRRQEYFRSSRAINYGFWCDWHAQRAA